MSVQLNHTIVHANDAPEAAAFFSDVLGLPAPRPFGPFLVVELAHGLSFDFMTVAGEYTPQHYAFLVTEPEFDAIYGRILERGLEHWPDPHGVGPTNTINHNDGGRGVYWQDPAGNYLEILTVPYGGWPT